ncbi:ORF128 [Staphylococcus phage X2]|uniref:ORF128 n=1 Tax=Staphylococcus phage X2 TaxID=2908152 RepID=Q4ZAA3_9CAUD|nr:ORF128 [Staphylococcus phage X2]AAX92075.1 ORF128 [Staphylococcus phage X2]
MKLWAYQTSLSLNVFRKTQHSYNVMARWKLLTKRNRKLIQTLTFLNVHTFYLRTITIALT